MGALEARDDRVDVRQGPGLPAGGDEGEADVQFRVEGDGVPGADRSVTVRQQLGAAGRVRFRSGGELHQIGPCDECRRVSSAECGGPALDRASHQGGRRILLVENPGEQRRQAHTALQCLDPVRTEHCCAVRQGEAMDRFRLLVPSESVQGPPRPLADRDHRGVVRSQCLCPVGHGFLRHRQGGRVIAGSMEGDGQPQRAFQHARDGRPPDPGPLSRPPQQRHGVRYVRGQGRILASPWARCHRHDRQEQRCGRAHQRVTQAGGGAPGDAFQQHSMGPQAAGRAGGQTGEGVVEQAAERRFDPGPGHHRVDARSGQQLEGQRIVGPAAEQTDQGRGFRQSLGVQGVQGQFPGRAGEMPRRVGTAVRGSLVQEIDGIDLAAPVQGTSVLRHTPGADHLVCQIAAREGESEGQPAQPVGDLRGFLRGAPLRRQVTQHLGRVLPGQHTDVVKRRTGPPVGGDLPGGDQGDSAGAGAQPVALPQDGGVVGVVDHQQPWLAGPVQPIPHEVRGRAQSVAGGGELALARAPIGGDGEHARAQGGKVRGVHPQADPAAFDRRHAEDLRGDGGLAASPQPVEHEDLIGSALLHGRAQPRHQLQPVAQDDRRAPHCRTPHGVGRGPGWGARGTVVVVLGDVLVPTALIDPAVVLGPSLGRFGHRSVMCWSRPAW